MARAAIYLRVSTDERSASLDAQESGARAWCERQGHAVAAVYRDEGISGAEWDERPGVLALLADAERTPRPWDLVVVRDLDRLGRDAVRLPLALSDLADACVAVWEWSKAARVELDEDAFALVQLRAAMVAAERRAIARRTRTALRQRAERGLVTGGRVYGYANARTSDGVRYEPHEREAPIVAELYERHARGESAYRLARALTARGVPAPRGAPSWCPRTVQEILRNERYRGVARWGEVGAVYRRGTRVTVPGVDVVTYAVPPIVTSEAWDAAQARSAPARAASGRVGALSREPRYLLVGHAVCGHCGGPLASWRTTRGSGPMASGGRRVVQTYRCGWHATRGDVVCPLKYMRPVEPIDRGVIASLADTLTPDRVRAALKIARRLQQPEAHDARRAEAEHEVAAGERQVRRLTEALRHGAADVPEVVTALRDARRELTEARARLDAAARPAARLDAAYERALMARAADVRASLAEALADAHRGDLDAMRDLRAVLGGALSAGPLVARWTGAELRVEGMARPGALLGESAGANTGGEHDPNGFLPVPVCGVG